MVTKNHKCVKNYPLVKEIEGDFLTDKFLIPWPISQFYSNVKFAYVMCPGVECANLYE